MGDCIQNLCRNLCRATEMFHYINSIFEAANGFIWDNVYSYDILPRRLMATNPLRNWGAIFLQAWDVQLRDPINRGNSVPNSTNGFTSNGKKKC